MSNRAGLFKLLLVLLIPSLACPGCGGQNKGPERGSLEGKVTFDGEPVQEGTISLVPMSGTKGPASGGPISNGKYMISVVKGPVIGKHRVEIRATRKTGKQSQAVPPATGKVDELEYYIPAKYNTSSTLTVDITKGENVTDFTLTK